MSVVETFHHAGHDFRRVTSFLVAGRYLDQSMRRKTRAVAGNLAALKAETATKFVGADEICEVPIAAVQEGDIVLLRPGERSAVDGSVIEGQSKIDQSLITGETLPARAGPGTAVYAGTLNLTGALRVRVAAAAEGTLLAEIARLLENAVQARSRYVQLADRASRLYAPVVHATALLTMLGWVADGASWHDAIITAIAVLIITCPCALGLAFRRCGPWYRARCFAPACVRRRDRTAGWRRRMVFDGRDASLPLGRMPRALRWCVRSGPDFARQPSPVAAAVARAAQRPASRVAGQVCAAVVGSVKLDDRRSATQTGNDILCRDRRLRWSPSGMAGLSCVCVRHTCARMRLRRRGAQHCDRSDSQGVASRP